MKNKILIFTGLFLWSLASYPQNVEMPGEVNHYLVVKAVLPDRVEVTSSSELPYFNSGDKVLLIQMTGATMPTNPGFLTNPNKYKDSWRNAGMYEILQVDNVISGANNFIVFTDNHINSYDAGEKIQLVRLVEGDNVTVTADVVARPWDGSTGGIIAIIGMDSLKLNANIEASNAGFRGGSVPFENYSGGCRSDPIPNIVSDTLHFDRYHTNRSGNKGEGIVTADSIAWPYIKGAGCAINGGGGGNGLFSGGGGGGNYWQGGDGGRQSASCADFPDPAWGGMSCLALYNVLGGVIMGGGGGSGVKNLPLYTASNGGNGGGLVFIITGVLKGAPGKYISVNGQSITTSVTGSGGGGGGAGAVIMDATSYDGSFLVKIRGGDGGPTNGAICTGAGGGGSGGLFWYSGNIMPITADNFDTIRGKSGGLCFSHYGNSGHDGTKLGNLMLNLTGFLFNGIRGVDTICAGQVPNKIIGSRPKGGDGTYTWQWEQSFDNTVWTPALGTSYRDSLRPVALSQTTYYRRTIRSLDKNADLIVDVSRSLEIFVYPAIGSNSVSGTDTICYNLPVKTLTGTNPNGGNGIYLYQWQYSTNQSDWNTGGIQASWDPGNLQQSMYYRRIVTSTAYCSHTSNTVKVTVLLSITNNIFNTPDTVICKDVGPGPLNARIPLNGDGLYTYQWQSRSTSGNWANIAGSNILRYNPGIMTDTVIYRRIVFSGNDNACRDTSQAKSVYVLPPIANNLISTVKDRYCAGETPVQLTGTQPAGGDLAYAYQWYSKTDVNWNMIMGATQRDFDPVDRADTTIRFRRLVLSGTYQACSDTSLVMTLDVVPPIGNEIDPEGQTICENSTPHPLSGNAATGGLGGFIYEWLQKSEGSGWITASGVHNQPSYTSAALVTGTSFARRTASDICSDTSSAVTIEVYPSIAGNMILGGPVQYTCYNTGKPLSGSQPAQGNGSYAYSWIESDNSTDWTLTPANGMSYSSNPLTAVKYFKRIVYSSAGLHECSDTSGMVQVRVNPLPTGDVIAHTDTLCTGEQLYVKFSTAGLHPPYAITIGGQTKTGVTEAVDSLVVLPLISQLYRMESIVDDSGCIADNSLFSVVAAAVVYPVPVANAGPDDEICGNSYTLHAVKSITGSAGQWTSSDATFADQSDAASNTLSNRFGTLEYKWTETNWHCTDDDQVFVTFYEQPAVPDAGEDQTLDFVYTAHLEGSVPSVGSGKWTILSGSGEFDNDTLPDAKISELDISSSLRWTVTNGICPAVSDDMQISIKPLEIPKAISPNGDNNNDFFDLGAVHAESIRIKIYNSTGVLVYESDDYVNDNLWDGFNTKGIELPEGTYFYIAVIKVAGRKREFQFKSFVEILR